MDRMVVVIETQAQKGHLYSCPKLFRTLLPAGYLSSGLPDDRVTVDLSERFGLSCREHMGMCGGGEVARSEGAQRQTAGAIV